ncbi:ribonuclease HI [Candidatus Peregrinibacteria bacterium HGW-Peregrinibacteria-1]|jgi:ribonuclease HI|nr:MAG: ribonuclease HI [Candidatus Peregrinibacteria bacterium HGW-Peregrinibacteria-1]
MMNIDIYTDGSCIGNPGPGGWAAIINVDGVEYEISGNEPDTTNNRMEMMAMIEALNWLKDRLDRLDNFNNAKITIYSDSNLIVKTLTDGWKRKANLDLWEKIDKVRGFANIRWVWVKAHANNKTNNRVDELAQKEARRLI